MADFAWMIEAPGPHYLSVRELAVHEFHWTADPNKGLRFASKDQADQVMMALRRMSRGLFLFEENFGSAKATEHGWIAPTGNQEGQ